MRAHDGVHVASTLESCCAIWCAGFAAEIVGNVRFRMRLCVLLNSQLNLTAWKLWYRHVLGNSRHDKGSLSYI